MPMPHLLPSIKPPAIAVGFVSPALEALERLEAGIAGGFPRFDATEERLERQIKPLERQL